MKIDQAKVEKFNFAGKEIEILSAENGALINVLDLLRNPQEFYGDPRVDYLIKFGGVFEGLIGKYKGQYGEWDKEKLADEGIVVLEYHYQEAKKIMDKVNQLAQELIKDGEKYDDQGFCKEYFELAKAGYELLAKHEAEFGFEEKGAAVSLERAGLVTTRLALGLDQDDEVKNEVRVVTKRTHLKAEPATYLSVTVKWRDKEDLKRLDKARVFMSDFVNPASGASGAALVVGLGINKIRPVGVDHRSISLTRQGVRFIKQAFKELGIEARFYGLGECDELNEAYYLIGNRAVADAGHVLRHFLPKWYKA